jgi:predicted Zn-dependent protease
MRERIEDALSPPDTSKRKAKERAGTLALWHAMLAGHLAGTDGAGLLDRLVSHRALAGPEVIFLRALIARVAGDLDSARKLIAHCLEELPGSYEFHSFAAEIGADLPPRARQVADERSRAQALIGLVRAD